MKTLAKLASLAFAAVALVLTGCGETTEQRAATGAVGGAVVAGPVGAAGRGGGGAPRRQAATVRH
jgi:osmotically inducible lipoprotein OsmB